jgi:hypothetical protein
VKEERVEGPDCFRFALRALRLTYRLPLELVDELQLLDCEAVNRVLYAAIDGPARRKALESQKKTTAA